MPSTVFGLPAHPLIIHATVVIVPAAALAVLLAGVWPRFRRWAGWGPLALAVVAVVLTPLSTSSGENLEKQVGGSKLIEEHSQLADMLIYWVVPLAVVAAALFFLGRRTDRVAVDHADGTRRPAERGQGALRVGLAVLAVVVGIGTLVQTVLIGHSGATSVWKGGEKGGDGGDSSRGAVVRTVPLG